MFQLRLESILQKALRKNSDERYQTIKEMLAELRILKAETGSGKLLAADKGACRIYRQQN